VEYGGTVKVAVRVTGGRVDSLMLHTRDDTGSQQAPCFRGEQGEFSQRVENVTRALTFWFSTGKSRSHFCRVSLLMTPRLTGLQAAVRAPAYARLAPQAVNPGLEPIRGLAGSEVELVARSNRPLLRGELLCRPADRSAPSSVPGVPAGAAGENAVRFRWRMDQPAALVLRVLDVDSNASRPVSLRQELVPDRPPEVTISEPVQVCLATPDSKIALAAAASDDYGVARLALVRSLKSFRDRERRLELPVEPPRNHPVSAEFDFADLGVSPGDEVEYFLEAQDTNPSGMGMGASPVGRIAIISREQFLELERTRARLEDFRNRYRAVADRMRQLADGTEEARQMMRQGRDQEAEKRIAELQSSARGLAAHLKLHCALVPLYDVEAEYQRELEVLRKEVEQAGRKLEAKDLEAAAAALKAGGQEYAQVMDSVELLAEVSEVLAMQAEFMRLYQIQKDAAARLRRFEGSGPPAAERKQTLEALAGIEARTAKELADFVKELRARAEKLPPDTPELKKSALAFADQVEKQEIGKDLDAAAGYARAGAGAEAAGRAQFAAEKMARLIGQCDGPGEGGGGWCRDGRFRPVDRSSLRQMLAGQGLGLGGGLGQGAGSGSGDGYSMSSHTPDNVRAYGPGTTGALSPRAGGPGSPSPSGEPGAVRVVRGGARPVATGATRGFRFNAAAGFPERYRQELTEYFQLIGRLAAEEEK